MKYLTLLLVFAGMLQSPAQERLDRSDEISKTPANEFEYVISCDRKDGMYSCGETATISVLVRDRNTAQPATSGEVRIDIDAYDNRVIRTERHDIAGEGARFEVKGTLDKPGFMRLRLYTGADRSRYSIWCVAFDPDRIQPGVDDPADFDAFWADAYAKYTNSVPFGFEMRFDKAHASKWNDAYRFSFNAPDGKTRLYGFITYPKDRTRRYPARFEVPSAGIGGWTLKASPYRNDRTVNVLLNIFPFEMPATVKEAQPLYDAYCKELKSKFGSKHYMAAGMGATREEATLYNYFLGAKRCIEWLHSQPEVDTSNFCYWGASQGGGYGTCVVGLSGLFTRAVVCVPCLICDLGRFGRLASGPDMLANQMRPEARENVMRNWPYFSAENFARRIRCETMVTVGFCDPTCAPHGGWSVYNLIASKRKSILGAVNQPHGPPDPVWYGTQEWLFGQPGWKETLGEQSAYLHGSCAGTQDAGDGRSFAYDSKDVVTISHPLIRDTYRFSVVADCHFAFIDDRDAEYGKYAARMAQWPGKESELDKVVASAKAHGSELLIMAGDMASFPSLANVEFIKRKMDESGLDCRYTAGNHDWCFEGMPGKYGEQRDEWISKRLLPLYRGEDPKAYSFVKGGVRFIMLDDSTAGVSEKQYEFVGRELAKGEPTILVMHIPFHVNDRSYSDAIKGRFRELVFSAPNVVAVFAGHDHRLQVSGERGVPQFVLPRCYTSGRGFNVVLKHE